MIADIKKSVETKMAKSLEALKADFGKIRAGRAHTGILDHVTVDYYGAATLISQVANITLIDARTIGVQPWEKKLISTLEKAIREADLGLNPYVNGDIIRVPMPVLTEERRRDLIKVVRAETETARIAIRNVRREANEQLKKMLKDKQMSEDDERRAQDEVQKLTNRFVAQVDKTLQSKETELLAV